MLFLFCIATIIVPSIASFNKEECLGTHPKVLDKYRLPKWFTPQNYTILMKFHIKYRKTFVNSTSTCTLLANRDAHAIYFHALGLEIFTIKVVELETAKNIRITRVDNICSREVIGIYFERDVVTGYHYSVTFKYIAKPENLRISGIYETWFEDEKRRKDVSVLSTFEPADARRAFPCLDEPEMKAIFKLTIIHPTDTLAFSNMPAINKTVLDESWIRSEYLPTLNMSTYLFAFYVGTFKQAQLGRVGVYTQPKFSNATALALNISTQIMINFGTLFQIRMSGVPKLDFLAVPHFEDGGMENWGLITYKEDIIIYDDESSDLDTHTYCRIVISHELAHNWWGNLVTVKWWDELFIQEGMASFWEMIGLVSLYPERNADVMLVHDSFYQSIEADDRPSKEPKLTIIPENLVEPRQLIKVFNYASYSKAAIIFRMLLYHLGRTAFLEGVREFLAEHSFSSVTAQDLYESFDTECQDYCKAWNDYPIARIMYSWTHFPGHPTVTLTRNYEDGSAVIHQENPVETLLFTIPITYTSNREKKWEARTKHIMETKTIEIKNIAGKDDWVILNLHMAGLYRTQYDYRNWLLITNTFYKSHQIIPVLNRAQVIYDLGDYTLHNPQSYLNLYLNLTRYLYFERNFAPWRVFFIETRGFMLALYDNIDIKRKWIAYLIRIMVPTYQEFYWNHTTFENMHDKEDAARLRNNIIHMMCIMGDKDCNSHALKLFRDWRDGLIEKIPVDFKKIAYCNGLYYGNKTDWDFMNKHYSKAVIKQERVRIFSAALCARKKEIYYDTKMKDIIYPLENEHREDLTDYLKAFLRRQHVYMNLSKEVNVDINDFYYNFVVVLGKNKNSFIYDVDQKEYESNFYDSAQSDLYETKLFNTKTITDFLNRWELHGENFLKQMTEERQTHFEPAYNNTHMLMNKIVSYML